MSDRPENPETVKVGYGRPPKSVQFKKGRSGNPKGRPKKPDPAIVDLDAILTDKVTVNGAQMDARELELRQQVKKALDPKGALKSVRYVLDRFEEYGAMMPPRSKSTRPELPSMRDVPWPVQETLLRSGIAPPWSKEEIAVAKTAYLETRDEGQRIYDVTAGYEEWLMK